MTPYGMWIDIGKCNCDLIGPAVLLAYDASGFVTGQTLVVDGGTRTS
jgi:NAD(P)-dependent dehydrogenase (short-subunit alcohol dehydrogenase family)